MKYDIWRFRFDEPKEYIKTVPDLIRAKEHCNNPKTKGNGYFDGYEEHNKKEIELSKN